MAFAIAALLLGGWTAERADLVVFGRVWTGDAALPWAEGVATRGDQILAVGDRAAIERHRWRRTRVIDNRDALVAPGFMDGHVHLLNAGFQLSRVSLRNAQTPEEFIAGIRDHAASLPPGEWIVGGRWDHENFPGTPLPRRDWIDSITPRHPVFISRLDGHMALANSLALERAGVTRATADVEGGVIVRDPDGTPTGILKDNAKALVERVIPPPSAAQVDRALARAMTFARSKGVTAVASVSAPWAEVEGLERARKHGALGVRVAVFPPLSEWRRVAERVRTRGPGDDWIRLAGVKGYADGSLGARTASLFEPYADDPATSGVITTPRETLLAQVRAADSAGLQVVVHAIGQRANAMVLDVYHEVASAGGPRDRRFRIEHAQHLRAAERERLVQQEVIASMQPSHVIDDGRWAEKRLGPERVADSYVFRELIDRKGRLAFGSDWPVAPLDPILGIYAAVTRRTTDGKHPQGWIPEQKISVEEALRAYTSGNAHGVFAEKTRGMLAPGHRADLVLLDRDLFTIPPEEIERARVRATITGGRVVYEAAAP
jgi:predicted amidohydrolase YtcJ